MQDNSRTPTGYPAYEIYALRYAFVDRPRYQNFISRPDDHDGPGPLDFFVWCIVDPTGARKPVLVDTGFDAECGAKRGRDVLRTIPEALELIGVKHTDIEHVIITHMHYDHGGCINDLPNAKFHVQDAEMRYCTGRMMTYGPLRHAFDETHVKAMISKLWAGRVVFHGGDPQWGGSKGSGLFTPSGVAVEDEIQPGVSVHTIGGHTGGLQSVRVSTARGWVCLASDASHFYENVSSENPFPIVQDVGRMIEGWQICRRLAENKPENVIPGHDPLVRVIYPSVQGTNGEAIRVDVHPSVWPPAAKVAGK